MLEHHTAPKDLKQMLGVRCDYPLSPAEIVEAARMGRKSDRDTWLDLKTDFEFAPKDQKTALESSLYALGMEIIGNATGFKGLYFLGAIILFNVLPYAARLYNTPAENN